MACDLAQMWNLSGLLAAFLDLWIAYVLLCASSLVFLISKLMGFFGLHLPCPCSGIFCSRRLCLNRLLVDIPTLKLAEVQLAVKQKFPFCGSANQQCNNDQRPENDTFGNRVFGVEHEASCSPSDGLDPGDMEKYDMKRKIGDTHQSRSRLSLLRKGSFLQGKRSLAPVESTSRVDDSDLGTSDSVSDSSDDDWYTTQKSESQMGNLGDTGCCSGDERNYVKILKQELDAERRAHAALYAELEKERSAAASAAEEAMAMILRLQEEKASIYMEAQQSHRIVEEKYAYDAEEISILKEILVRREKEKHVLEKEVEAYRQMAFTDDTDPMLFLHDIVASPNNKDPQYTSNRRDFDGKSEGMSSCNSGGPELHEKEIISVSNPIQYTSMEANELEQIVEINVGCEMGEKIIETCSGGLYSYPGLKPAEVCDLSTHISNSSFNKSRENSEMVHGLPHIASNLLPPSLDRKMGEIHGELGLLQERLELIQKGKGRRRLPGDTQARDNMLSDDYATTLRAAQPVTEPRQAVRPRSLSLPSTKAYSRK